MLSKVRPGKVSCLFASLAGIRPIPFNTWEGVSAGRRTGIPRGNLKISAIGTGYGRAAICMRVSGGRSQADLRLGTLLGGRLIEKRLLTPFV